jgi:hypothetical protein
MGLAGNDWLHLKSDHSLFEYLRRRSAMGGYRKNGAALSISALTRSVLA